MTYNLSPTLIYYRENVGQHDDGTTTGIEYVKILNINLYLWRWNLVAEREDDLAKIFYANNTDCIAQRFKDSPKTNNNILYQHALWLSVSQTLRTIDWSSTKIANCNVDGAYRHVPIYNIGIIIIKAEHQRVKIKL